MINLFRKNKKPTLELPITLRFAEKNEVPNNSSVQKRVELINKAKIVEGYKILPKDKNPEHSDLPFNFYAEININNSRLWELILALSEVLPDEVSVIFNHEGDEPEYGKYYKKNETLDFLSKYKSEIVEDTFIEIGMIFNSDSELIEMFIADSKYIKFWGTDSKSFIEIMNKFKLKQINDIEFVDEYPKVREPLRLFKNDIVNSNELIEQFRLKFTVN